MSDKKKDIALFMINKLIKKFEQNIEQYKRTTYNEANIRTNFAGEKTDKVCNKDIEKYFYNIDKKKKKIYIFPEGCICEQGLYE